MCGIIGIVGRSSVVPRLIDGLKRLEYRGYDSAGIAVLNDSHLLRRRAKGKIVNLESAVSHKPMDGPVGIAHTRWATHGIPNEANAHPHFAGDVGVVHNGIIENYSAIRQQLNGRKFESETDTETAAHLIDQAIKNGCSPKDAFAESLKKLTGAYALGVIIDGLKHTMFAARAGSPLAIGIGKGEMYIGSDALALAQLTSELVYLEEGDWAVLQPDSYEIFDKNDKLVTRDITIITAGPAIAEKGDYDHYMLKEIYEQPSTFAQTLSNYITPAADDIVLPSEFDFSNIDRVYLIACGTAYYAGGVAKYWFEQVAGIAADIDIASEFRYRNPILAPNSLFIAISQSGETADTLAALRYCQQAGIKTAALVNVMTSSMAREADIAWPIDAGPEIGVASTKAFTSQLGALACLVLAAAKAKKRSPKAIKTAIDALEKTPALIQAALGQDKHIRAVAAALSKNQDAFFLGRGRQVPIAFEGALKLKEISYIHAEGYAAGELKHGPIALIEDGTPVIVIAPVDDLFEKTISNMQEVSARGAEIILITDEKGLHQAGNLAHSVITMPDCDPFIAPIIMTLAVQLLAYHAAVHLGTDVDQPRNLAKSVTVE